MKPGGRFANSSRRSSCSTSSVVFLRPLQPGFARRQSWLVAGNHVQGNDFHAIIVATLEDHVSPIPFPYPPGVDSNPNLTLVHGNIVTGSGLDLGWPCESPHNSWIGNTFADLQHSTAEVISRVGSCASRGLVPIRHCLAVARSESRSDGRASRSKRIPV